MSQSYFLKSIFMNTISSKSDKFICANGYTTIESNKEKLPVKMNFINLVILITLILHEW